MLANISTVWKPIPNSSQELALDTRCHHTLYTGARGPGKTDTQLMRFRRRVGVGYGEFWRGIIIDKEYKNLGDIVQKSKRWFNAFKDGARFMESGKDYKWVWPTGEQLLFRAAAKEQDYWDYHGHEYPYIGFNELTKYASADLYDAMQSTNRSSFLPEDHPLYIDRVMKKERGLLVFVDRKHKNAVPYQLAPIPLESFSTTNPYGPGHGWVKRRFIDPAPYGTVVKQNIEIISAKTKEKMTVTVSQVAIFGSYVENPYLDNKYIATLNNEKNKARKKAWLSGSWDIVAGGAFDDVFERDYNVVPRFKIPKGWSIDRTYDDGSSHPFSVGWWAEANGEEADVIMPDGQVLKFCPYPGSLIQIAEWYGTEELGTNKGLKMASRLIAQGIKAIEDVLMSHGWIQTKPWPGPADNRIRNVIDAELDTTEKIMSDHGVHWTSSDKSPGSRINGMNLTRDRMLAAQTGDAPALYFMDNCVASIATIPVLPRAVPPKSIDDVDTDAEDHAYDMVRYRVLAGSRPKLKSVEVKLPG